jgi:hypothetical protein
MPTTQPALIGWHLLILKSLNRSKIWPNHVAQSSFHYLLHLHHDRLSRR